MPLAGELMGGTEDPRASCAAMLDRAIAALPAGVERVRCRWDAGYFVAELVTACLGRGVEFAIGAKRTAPVMSAAAGVPEPAWVPAVGMETPSSPWWTATVLGMSLDGADVFIVTRNVDERPRSA